MSLLDAIVMRFGDALFAGVPETDLASLSDRNSEQIVGGLGILHGRTI